MAAHTGQPFGTGGLRLWGPLVLLCAFALPLVSDQKQQIVVVSVSGDWTRVRQNQGEDASDNTPKADLERPVRFGQTLNGGAVCLVGQQGTSIVLKYSTADNILYPFPCERSNLGGTTRCAVDSRQACAVDLRDLSHQKGILAAFAANTLETMLRVVRAQPEKYMVAGSRGAEAELTDAVVPLERGQIDLGAIFREMDPGSYYVAFSAVDAAAFPGPPAHLSYAKGQPAVVPARGLQPGLHKVFLVDQKGEPAVSDCWILVAAGPQYAEQAAAYEQAVSASAKLPEEMDAGATRGLLRAYMEALARARQGAPQP